MAHPPERPEIRPGIARLFRLALRRPDRAHAEADEEIRLHLQLRVEQLVRDGLSPAAARAEAERRFGPLDDARARLHASAVHREDRMRRREWFAAVRQDLRVSLRGMRRTPGFAATAVVCLALGIGANAATFSMFDEILLRPLAVREPERLVNLAAPGVKPGWDSWTPAGTSEALFSYPMYRDLARAQTVFTHIAAHRLFPVNLAYRDQSLFGQGLVVSGSYFPMLGLRPEVGRLLTPADDEKLGAHPVAVLSHSYWTTRFGADPSVIGEPIVVNGRSLSIVGVAPHGFEGTTLGVRPQVYAPLAMAGIVDPSFGSGPAPFENRSGYWLYLFARLRPGVSRERAAGVMNALYSPILADVEAPLHAELSAETLARFKARTLTVEDGRRGQSILRGETRAPLIFLFAITGLVVVIAAANVANLLLARAATRATEMAVRLSLGAGRLRLVVQLLVESCLLAAFGGLASLAVAHGTLTLIASLIPRTGFGTGANLALELRWTVVLFAAAVSVGTGLFFGLVPALQSTRPDLIRAIRASSGQLSGSRATTRFRTSLVTAQIALSTALLIAAGLFVKSLRNVSRVDLGLEVDRVITFGIAPGLSGYDPSRTRALFAQIEQEIAALPGVASVGASAIPLLTGGTNGGNVRVEGFQRGPDTDANTRLNRIGPGFFRALGVPLLAGREFSDADRLGSPKVAVVNEAFVKKFGLVGRAVGRRMGHGGPEGPLDIDIVGLVRDTKYNSVKGRSPPLVYTPYRQDSLMGASFFYVRASVPPEGLLKAVRGVVERLDPKLPLAGLKILPQQVRENVYLDRLIGTLSASFAALATILAAIGLYGVLSFTVAQRTREIGVRMALGADGRRVRGMVLGQVGRMTVIGGAIGLAAAFGIGRAAQSLLFQLEGYDATVFAVSALVLASVALAAGYIPAWRASRVDPMRALRGE